MKNNTNENLHVPSFLKSVLKQITKNKKRGNITKHPRPSYYHAPEAEQLPLFKNRKTTIPNKSKKQKQLDLPMDIGMTKGMTPYTNPDKWLSENFDKDWTYIGFDLTGYSAGLLPDGAYTKGNTLENPIYQSAIIANPDVFMNEWNEALKQKLDDRKKNQEPSKTDNPSAGENDEDMSVNEILTIIKEIVDEEVSEVNATNDDSGNVITAQGAPGSVIRFATENPKLIKQMRDWVKDCQWADLSEEDVDGLSEEELLKGIQNSYSGGIKGFIQDSASTAEVPIGYKEDIKEIMHPDDEADLAGDGYTNDYQRAFAHSQSTTSRKNARPKAIELAKQGKYVILREYPVHCKVTDACLGGESVIHKVCNSPEEVQKEIKVLEPEMEHSDDSFEVITPEMVKEPTSTTKDIPKGGDDDVPFEGVGYVYDKDMKKDPKHIPGERWRVKFQESVKRSQLKQLIRSIISESLYGDKIPLKEIIQGYDEMINLIKNMSPDEQAELNLFVKSQKNKSAYDAVLAYFQEKATTNKSAVK